MGNDTKKCLASKRSHQVKEKILFLVIKCCVSESYFPTSMYVCTHVLCLWITSNSKNVSKLLVVNVFCDNNIPTLVLVLQFYYMLGFFCFCFLYFV